MRATIACLLIILALMALGYIGAYDWTHPDMTDKRVFLNTWPIALFAIVSGFVGYLMLGGDKK